MGTGGDFSPGSTPRLLSTNHLVNYCRLLQNGMIENLMEKINRMCDRSKPSISCYSASHNLCCDHR